MLCCFQPWTDPKDAYDRQTSDGISGFPGQRRGYVKTAGNALAAASLEHSYPQQPQQTQQPQKTQQLSQHLIEQQTPLPPPVQPQSGQPNGGFIQVKVPAGAYPGQVIHVIDPNGNGEMIQARIPDNLPPGSLFYIQAPSRSSTPIPSATAPVQQSPMKATAPLRPMDSASPSPSPIPMAHAQPLTSYAGVPAMQPPTTNPEPRPFANCLDDPVNAPVAHQHHQQQQQNGWQATNGPANSFMNSVPSVVHPVSTSAPNNNGMALLRVRVPPGTAPGSTIHVQVPGENRKIAAKVPPNCTEFHVQYRVHSASGSQSLQQSQQLQQQPAPPKAPNGQKLLRVQVPPGATPGATIHVRIPDEPDRLVQVKVPPGNVREFHVAYQPRVMQGRPQSSYGSSSNNSNNNSGNDWDPAAALPVIGGLATVAAGAMVYEHFAHHN